MDKMDEKITWKAVKTPKPRYKVLTFREYCENGMSHRK